jgi:hypothetical protein
MNKKEVNNLIVRYMSAYLEPDGYKYVKSQEVFILKKDKFAYTILHNCVDKKPEFSIEFFLEIRHEEIENIANKFSSSNPAFFQYSATIIVQLSYFTGKFMKFKVVTEEDVKKVVDDFFNSFYKNSIRPFFDKYSIIGELSNIVNEAAINKTFGIPVNIRTYQKNIILLKLTGNRDFENRVQVLRERINDFPDMDKKMFENTYGYLKSL